MFSICSHKVLFMRASVRALQKELSMGSIAPRRRVPEFAFFEITEACNLRCRHCEADAGRRDPAELTTAEALDVATQLGAAGCRQVNLTGGEPLVRRDWEAIARRFADLGVEVTLATNGTLIDEPMVERLVAAGVRNVAVSLDGDKERHDALRTAPGSAAGSPFDRAVRALRPLAARGLRTAVVTVVHRGNAEALPAVHALAVELGAEIWQVQLAFPMGRFSAMRETQVLSAAEIPELEARLAALIRRGGVRVVVGDNIGYYGAHEVTLRSAPGGPEAFFTGCSAGLRVVGIRSNGDVKGCPSHPAALAVGNLRRESFAAIWGDAARFSYNTAFEEADLVGGCRTCAFRRICRAGCTTMAYALTGTVYDNPLCRQRVGSAMKDSSKEGCHG
jgi:radical SAM protein with 4Fe4S-binding SPASM domain